MQVADSPVGVEEDKDSAVVTSAGTQDFVGFADDSFDLVCRNDVDVCLRVEQYGVGLVIVRGQWRAD